MFYQRVPSKFKTPLKEQKSIKSYQFNTYFVFITFISITDNYCCPVLHKAFFVR